MTSMNTQNNNGEPYRTYALLRDLAPIHWSGDSWIVTRYKDVFSLLSDKRLSANRISPVLQKYIASTGNKDAQFLDDVLRGWTLFTDPPNHSEMRSDLNKIFMPFTQEVISPSLHEKIRSIILPLIGSGNIDLMRDIAYPIHHTILSDMFGVDRETFEKLLFLSNELNFFIGEPSLNNTSGITKATQAIKEMHEIFLDIYEMKKNGVNDDLLSCLLKLTPEENKLLIFQHYSMLFMGSESVHSQLGNSIMLLGEHYDQYEKLKHDMNLLKYAVRECLRYEPPIHFIQRVAVEDFVLHDNEIKAGQNISLLIASAHRDPLIFSNPDVFNVSRMEKGHVAFGVGAHACIGGAISNEIASTTLKIMTECVSKIVINTQVRDWHQIKGTRRLNSLSISLL